MYDEQSVAVALQLANALEIFRRPVQTRLVVSTLLSNNHAQSHHPRAI